VIEGVRELFAEEGVEEQVLKDLKQVGLGSPALLKLCIFFFFRDEVPVCFFVLQSMQTFCPNLELHIPCGCCIGLLEVNIQ